jgi:hypothetical protein
MALIKKVDVKAYFATRRDLSITTTEAASKRVKIVLARAKPAGARTTSAEFLQDFCLEHSSRGASVPLVAGLTGSAYVQTVRRNLHA